MYLIDANIFLELELAQKRSPEVEVFLYELKSGKQKGVVTDFTIDSVVLVMETNGKNANDLFLFLSGLLAYTGLAIYSLSLSDKITAIELMKKHKLDFDDALIVQAMHSNNITQLISFDDDFDGISGIKRLEPAQTM